MNPILPIEDILINVANRQWRHYANAKMVEHAQSRETSRLRVTSSVSTTEPFSTHDVTLGDVDGSLFHIQI